MSRTFKANTPDIRARRKSDKDKRLKMRTTRLRELRLHGEKVIITPDRTYAA